MKNKKREIEEREDLERLSCLTATEKEEYLKKFNKKINLQKSKTYKKKYERQGR